MTKDKTDDPKRDVPAQEKKTAQSRIFLISALVLTVAVLFIPLVIFLHKKADERSAVQAVEANHTPASQRSGDPTKSAEPAPCTIAPTAQLATNPAATPSTLPAATPRADPTVRTEPVTDPPTPSIAKTTAPTPSAAPIVTLPPAPTPTPFTGYDYPEQVPASAPAGWDYFEDAVFIGDSRMEDFALFTGMAKYAAFYTHIGVSVNQIVADNPEKRTLFLVGGEKLTLEEALTKYNDFSKVYIMLGYNEIGWPYPAEFIKYYVKVLDLIRSIKPDVQIYVESVIPVARTIRGIGVDPSCENNENIALFNQLIYEMCRQQNVCFLNVQEALVDEEGYLPDGAASDGIHMGKEYCIKWMDYIKSHIAQE